MDITGRKAAMDRNIRTVSSRRYLRSSACVNTDVSTPEPSASTMERTTVQIIDTTTVYLSASEIMSNRFMPYSAEHTATNAPPMACAMMRMKLAILHPVEYIPTASVPPQRMTRRLRKMLKKYMIDSSRASGAPTENILLQILWSYLRSDLRSLTYISLSRMYQYAAMAQDVMNAMTVAHAAPATPMSRV